MCKGKNCCGKVYNTHHCKKTHYEKPKCYRKCEPLCLKVDRCSTDIDSSKNKYIVRYSLNNADHKHGNCHC